MLADGAIDGVAVFGGYEIGIASGDGENTSSPDGCERVPGCLSGEPMRSEEPPTIAIGEGVRIGERGAPAPGLSPKFMSGAVTLFGAGSTDGGDPSGCVSVGNRGSGESSLPRLSALGTLYARARGPSGTLLVSVRLLAGAGGAGGPLSR